MIKWDFNWKAIMGILAVIAWLMYQFTIDVQVANSRVKELYGVHTEDVKAILEEFSEIGKDETLMLEKLAANEESHKNTKERLDRVENKLDKIYDLMLKEKHK